MQDLTPRQIDLLKAIIAQYTETGEAVGSDVLDKRYNLGVSPATIRNDMVELAKKDYLKKEYFSSGRVPTSKAFRFYIKNLMREKELSTAEEVSYKSDIWDFRSEFHQLLQHATQSLAKKTQMLAVATTNRGDVYYFGVNNVLSNKEFWDIDQARSLFELFDQLTFWTAILERFKEVDDNMLFMFAEDEDRHIENVASVFGEFEGPNIRGAIGVIGPRRMKYEVIIPTVKYCRELIAGIASDEK